MRKQIVDGTYDWKDRPSVRYSNYEIDGEHYYPLNNQRWYDWRCGLAPYCYPHWRIPSLDEMAKFQALSEVEDHTHTGTLVGSHRQEDGQVRVHVFEPDDALIDEILANIYCHGRRMSHVLFPIESDLSKKCMERARSFLIPGNGPEDVLEYRVKADSSGDSEWSRSEIVKAVMPENAKTYGDYIAKTQDTALLRFFHFGVCKKALMLNIVSLGADERWHWGSDKLMFRRGYVYCEQPFHASRACYGKLDWKEHSNKGKKP